MVRTVAWLLPQFSKLSSLMLNPSVLVRSFITAFEKWNADAMTRLCGLKAGGPEYQSAISRTEREYDELIKLHCVDFVSPQPVSFGNDPMHASENETIRSITENDSSAVVLTEMTGAYDFVSVYEYHLLRYDGHWKIKSVLYVEDDGKHECL